MFCLHCVWSVSNCLSEEIGTNNGSRERKFVEVTVRAVITFRDIDKGHEDLSTFARLMNIKRCLKIDTKKTG